MRTSKEIMSYVIKCTCYALLFEPILFLGGGSTIGFSLMYESLASRCAIEAESVIIITTECIIDQTRFNKNKMII
jgi:hypothetical protein